ncbi:MAG: sigma-70 family RNA polymerase sigma factor [Luteolibacter sp.]|uniref:sigma-70 family RNA polymerase sigma factor n=1 Tax=Luteolibacter sp. TaxID=1962973 RepID=UPI0032648A96
MSAFAHTSLEGDDSFPLQGKLPQPARGVFPESANGLSQANAEDFTLHWSRTQLSVRAFLNSYLSDRSSVDDCIQEVALLAWKKGPRGHAENEPFLAFCLACARRIAMAQVRKKYRNRFQMLSPDTIASLADTVATMEQQEVREATVRISSLQSCLDSLEPAPRRLLELRYSSKDQTALQKEAKSTGKSMDAIYKKLERLRALLRECVTRKSTLTE